MTAAIRVDTTWPPARQPLLWIVPLAPIAKGWIAELRGSGPSPWPNLGGVMDSGFGEVLGNLVRNLIEGRIGVRTAVFESAS